MQRPQRLANWLLGDAARCLRRPTRPVSLLARHRDREWPDNSAPQEEGTGQGVLRGATRTMPSTNVSAAQELVPLSVGASSETAWVAHYTWPFSLYNTVLLAEMMGDHRAAGAEGNTVSNLEGAATVLKAVAEACRAGWEAAESGKAYDAVGFAAAHSVPAVSGADLLVYAYARGYLAPVTLAALEAREELFATATQDIDAPPLKSGRFSD